jgi:predicted GNAT family acetyltransferase
MSGEGTMTNSEVSKLTMENNEATQRWEAHLDQHLAVAEYRRRGDTLFFIHTEVPRELEGQGVASRLVLTALDDARTEHLAVVPFCPFVASYIRRHPDYKPLVHPDYRDLIEGEWGKGRTGEQ